MDILDKRVMFFWEGLMLCLASLQQHCCKCHCQDANYRSLSLTSSAIITKALDRASRLSAWNCACLGSWFSIQNGIDRTFERHTYV